PQAMGYGGYGVMPMATPAPVAEPDINDGSEASEACGGEDEPAPALPAPAARAIPVAPKGQPAPPGAPMAPPQFVVLLLDAETYEEIGVYREHAGPIASLAFSPDGSLIASGGGTSLPAPAGPMPGPMPIPQAAPVAAPAPPAAEACGCDPESLPAP